MFPVVTHSAVVTLSVGFRIYTGCIRLHGKANVYVANTAGKLIAMKPMFKNNWSNRRRGV
jgi:hypothetical protein